MDRGGDRSYIFNYLLHNKLRFLIRVRGDRGLRTAQGIEPAVDLTRSCPVLFYETVVKEEAGHERLVQTKLLKMQNPLPVQPTLFSP